MHVQAQAMIKPDKRDVACLEEKKSWKEVYFMFEPNTSTHKNYLTGLWGGYDYDHNDFEDQQNDEGCVLFVLHFYWEWLITHSCWNYCWYPATVLVSASQDVAVYFKAGLSTFYLEYDCKLPDSLRLCRSAYSSSRDLWKSFSPFWHFMRSSWCVYSDRRSWISAFIASSIRFSVSRLLVFDGGVDMRDNVALSCLEFCGIVTREYFSNQYLFSKQLK